MIRQPIETLSEKYKQEDFNYINMRRSKRPEPQTELERLQRENEYLRAENALLKKVRTLMQEKRNRRVGIGQSPSEH
jgi:transposase-like protein